MNIQRLQLKNYRNYDSLDITFSPYLNLLIGANGQGKTNILESICFLASTRSHRTNKATDLIQKGAKEACIQGEVERLHTHFPLSCRFSKEGKQLKVNHLPQKKMSQYIGRFHAVLFCPDDLSLIKDTPQRRRTFLDQELSQLNLLYLNTLTEYTHILKNRNAYLHQEKIDFVYLQVLDEQLAAAGSKLMLWRQDFLQALVAQAQPIYQFLTEDQESLTLEYKPSFDIQEADHLQEQFLQQLQANQERDLRYKSTQLGLQRDDWTLCLNGQEAKNFASQGQQRLLILSLKLAEVEYIKEKIGEYPVLLLDDVMSELDNQRQVRLLQWLDQRIQTILTTTTLDHLQNKLLVQPHILYIEQGQISKEEN